eukprot:scaffold22865_cov92-Isochrysis_galbana.AAC.1
MCTRAVCSAVVSRVISLACTGTACRGACAGPPQATSAPGHGATSNVACQGAGSRTSIPEGCQSVSERVPQAGAGGAALIGKANGVRIRV